MRNTRKVGADMKTNRKLGKITVILMALLMLFSTAVITGCTEEDKMKEIDKRNLEEDKKKL